MVQKALENPSIGSPAEREEVTANLFRHGHESRRRAITRSKAVHKDRTISWNNIPREFAFLPDGSRFLQLMTADVHIYYSCTTIKKAYENGLFALVADGVHKILPTQLGYQAQLYTIHGVCSNGHEIPLLYALTRAQRESTYELVFSCLERELRSLGPQCVRRFVVDFERAAINAANKTFPGVNVEDCAFHLA
ncbi:unnamed protein product [Heligmosomoides polygyrus]|uniref:MULE domain-containing protein n=1 Tax=Heligmosomoides polygyrus TaxID=6339 RepID=A0A183GQX5_HELPZ|nr:unnamed protein product [Heligmosomoides polygyrus]